MTKWKEKTNLLSARILAQTADAEGRVSGMEHMKVRCGCTAAGKHSATPVIWKLGDHTFSTLK